MKGVGEVLVGKTGIFTGIPVVGTTGMFNVVPVDDSLSSPKMMAWEPLAYSLVSPLKFQWEELVLKRHENKCIADTILHHKNCD